MSALSHFVSLYFLVYKDYHHKKKEAKMENERDRLMRSLIRCRQATTDQTSELRVVQRSSIAETIKILQHEEDEKLRKQLMKIGYYDKALETFLDIKCSWVKKKQERLELQEQLLRNTGSDANTVISYLELKEIFQYDPIFCGSDKQSNGKLRQLYVQNWKLQVERDKYKNIVEKLKQHK